MAKENYKIENSFEYKIDELRDQEVISPITNFIKPQKQVKAKTVKEEKVHFCWNAGKINEYTERSFNIFKELRFVPISELLNCLNQEGAIWAVKKKKGKWKRKGDHFKKAELIFVSFDLEIDEIISRFGDQLTAVFLSPKLGKINEYSTVAVFRLKESVSASFFELINNAFVEVHGSLTLAGPSQAFLTMEKGLMWASKETQYLDVNSLLKQFRDLGAFLFKLKKIFYRFDDFLIILDFIMTLRSKYIPDLERFDQNDIEKIELMKPKSKCIMKPVYSEYWLEKILGPY
ncbi:hypothetical protein LFX25_03505 [Leptospira sp. FAT2]|uniref:hypothetical protein n=1 Tax=Leptospira sanjuanensis TaxID=2879643 RepID=UPI001EE7EFC3|nr:hypothetical protein [Leptospira sanjuanensis]MCG6192306.1 hypothetical protein [Leptospira sanjuanensis]